MCEHAARETIAQIGLDKPEETNSSSSSLSGEGGTRVAALDLTSRRIKSAMFELGFRVSNLKGKGWWEDKCKGFGGRDEASHNCSASDSFIPEIRREFHQQQRPLIELFFV